MLKNYLSLPASPSEGLIGPYDAVNNQMNLYFLKPISLEHQVIITAA